MQYDKDLLEVWDEAKRLRCEWFNDYEKTASKPPMVIADLDVIQLDFRGSFRWFCFIDNCSFETNDSPPGDNVDCWMEIQHGKGPWAPPVSGIVPLGSTLTLVVAINDYRGEPHLIFTRNRDTNIQCVSFRAGEFDMRVKSCYASDGGNHVIKLTDEYGCVLRPKMISRFLKARAPDEKATVITYAFFHAFKFPDALSVHIKCKVEICRHGCLEHCQVSGSNERKDVIDVEAEAADIMENKFTETNEQKPEILPDKKYPISDKNDEEDDVENLYDDLFANADELVANFQHAENQNEEVALPLNSEFPKEILKKAYLDRNDVPDERFPHGPRKLESKDRMGIPPVAGPRSLNINEYHPNINQTFRQRQKRSYVVSDRKTRSANIGVSGIYEVISEADLAFNVDGKQEAVTVFQGRITEEILYGICMPVTGFSILFIIVAATAIVAALVAGSLLYRYQLQKSVLKAQEKNLNSSVPQEHLNPNILASWINLKLFRMGH